MSRENNKEILLKVAEKEGAVLCVEKIEIILDELQEINTTYPGIETRHLKQTIVSLINGDYYDI